MCEAVHNALAKVVVIHASASADGGLTGPAEQSMKESVLRIGEYAIAETRSKISLVHVQKGLPPRLWPDGAKANSG